MIYMNNFYDTNILLNNISIIQQDTFFYISNITIQELENIKTSYYKDEQIKYKARYAIRWLKNNQDRFEIVIYKEKRKKIIESNDKKIIYSALQINKKTPIIFNTSDLNCYFLAKIEGLKTNFIQENNKPIYNGYKSFYCDSDQDLSILYVNLFNHKIGENFNINEYLLIYDQHDQLIDKYRYVGNHEFTKISTPRINSKMFGKIKPIDPYQQLVLDSFKNNKITLLKGPAGTGKSLLSMAYLFHALENGEIDKIIIFCNTVATAGSAKLGYYPGSRTEKLLDSQIGNFLISKIGDKIAVQQLISEGKLLLLPISDIRGFDTSNMKAGIYITQAQNLTIDLMKLALQRIGQDSFCILDGDNTSQVDLNLYAGVNNGLKRVSEVFRGQDFYGEIMLKTIHRSRIAEIANKM